jgi:hypothetical protein
MCKLADEKPQRGLALHQPREQHLGAGMVSRW